MVAAVEAIGRGVNRQIYTRMFLKSMLPKALKKAAQFPGLLDPAALHRVRDLYQFKPERPFAPGEAPSPLEIRTPVGRPQSLCPDGRRHGAAS